MMRLSVGVGFPGRTLCDDQELGRRALAIGKTLDAIGVIRSTALCAEKTGVIICGRRLRDE